MRMDELLAGLKRERSGSVLGEYPLIEAMTTSTAEIGYRCESGAIRRVASFEIGPDGHCVNFSPFSEARVGDWERVRKVVDSLPGAFG